MNGSISPGDTYEKHDGRTAFFVDEMEIDRIRESKSSALNHVEQMIGSHGPALLRVYLNTTHSNFPIIEDGFFTDFFEGNKFNIDPALLAAIYALTLPWYARDLSTAESGRPDVAQLEDLAFRLFGESLSKPTLSTIQTGILLMQRPNVDSKTLNTQLVAAAYELGLHLDCTYWTSPASDKGLRKRLAWALFMQDKWCALIHGRPSAIVQSNWAVRTLTDDDFDDKTTIPEAQIPDEELDRGRELFKHMATLTEILSTLLDTFYTLQAMQEVDDAGPGGTRLILERAKPVQIRLKAWFAGLPNGLKMDNTMTGKPSSTGKSIPASLPPPHPIPPTNPTPIFSRLPPPLLLRHRNHPPPQHHPLPQPELDLQPLLHRHRPLPHPHLPLRRENAPHLRHGLREPTPPRTPRRLLVLPVARQLRPHRHLRQLVAGHRPLPGGSRLLPHPPGRVSLDAGRELSSSGVFELCGAESGEVEGLVEGVAEEAVD